jgi:hypothetical protein
VQVIGWFDYVLVILITTGQPFAQNRGGWEPIPGIKGKRIISIADRPNGGLVAITATGRIFE